MPDDLKDKIRENADGPAKAAGDAGSVEQHKLAVSLPVPYTSPANRRWAKSASLRWDGLVRREVAAGPE